MRHRWLGKMLEKACDEAGLKTEDLVGILGRNRQAIGRILNGEYTIKIEELTNLLDSLRLAHDDPQRLNILKLAGEVTKRNWYDGYGFDSGLADYVWLEENATRVLSLSTSTVPGPFQIPEFARALLENGTLKDDPDQIDRALGARKIRALGLREGKGPEFSVVIEATVFDHMVGGKEVMARQLEHLLEVTKYPKVEIRVLPRDAWLHIALGIESGFTLFEMPNDWPTVVAAPTPAGTLYIESPDVDPHVSRYRTVWDDIAIDGPSSISFIRNMLKDVTRK
jgi:transcriptional regulator with XRE-family HTH domain